MKRLKLFFLIFLAINSFGQQADWQTYYEHSEKKATPRYDQTIDFCKRLDSASAMVTCTSFGKSGQGRDLVLVIVDKDGKTDPAAIRSGGKVILLIQACIHPGESEGKDAGLMLIRDLVIRKMYPGLLDHVSILFIPIFNTDGHERFGPYNRINQNGPVETGWRVTADNHNLNRDYLKADTPEMQAWLQMFSIWMPDFFIDTHTTDGADYQYVLTYQMELSGDMDKGLTSWADHTFLEELKGNLENEGIPVFPYIEFRDWSDIRSGLITYVAPPMLSNGYTALLNRPALLIETHMLKPYETRVNATYQCLLNSIRILNREHLNLAGLVRKADRYASSVEFRKTDFPLQFETSETDSILINFLGISYEQVKSPVTGRNYYHYTGEKKTMHLPYFNKIRPSVLARLPEAYILPPQWKEVIRRMDFHGIRMNYLQKDTTIRVASWKITGPSWQQNPYEGRHPLTKFVTADTVIERTYPAGSVIIDLAQPCARLIAQMLEPKGDGSLLYWGFFDGIFEQKEYAEQYVMEPIAEKMLADDPRIRDEFESMKKNDSVFASNSFLMLNWFYGKTPYRDPNKNMYPVGKIYDRKLADRLVRMK